MNLFFENKLISGIVTVLPSKIIKFEDEMEGYSLPIEKSLKLKKIIGFNQKRVVDLGVTASDLSVFGIEYLINNNKLNKDNIDAIIFISQTPDYIMPPTSNLIQSRLGLSENTYCIDINQGCAGYLIGLFQSFMLLEQENINTVVLINADVLSTKVSVKDRNSNPIVGDAASISIIKKGGNNKIFATLNMNGQGGMALNIPAGGARMPSSSETSIESLDNDGNIRSNDHLRMKGDEVFNFVQDKVPQMIDNLFSHAKLSKNDIKNFAFHQPNKFMLNKLADKLNIERDNIPSNIVENFGNSSGVTIPLNLCFNFKDNLLLNSELYCLAGFGSGLTWASCLMNLGKLNFCDLIEYK